MNKKNILMIIMIIGIMLVVAESFLLNKSHKKTEEINKKKEQWDISERKCYENLCTDVLTAVDKENEKYFQFKLTNEGENAVESRVLQIILNDGITKRFYCPKLESHQSIEVKVPSNSKDLKKIKSYEIVENQE